MGIVGGVVAPALGQAQMDQVKPARSRRSPSRAGSGRGGVWGASALMISGFGGNPPQYGSKPV
jgi:hypothetical protein